MCEKARHELKNNDCRRRFEGKGLMNKGFSEVSKRKLRADGIVDGITGRKEEWNTRDASSECTRAYNDEGELSHSGSEMTQLDPPVGE